MRLARVAALLVAFLALLTLLDAALGTSAQAAGESITVRVTIDDKPFPDAHVKVTSSDGDEVASATTDEQGRATVALPAAGSYVVELDVTALPQGVRLERGQTNRRTLRVFTGATRPVLFALTTGAKRGGGSGINEPLQLFAEGIRFGLIIAMASVGLSLIFGTTGLVNFAHGELVSFGAIMSWYVNVNVGLNLIPATLIGMALGALAGGAQELGLWRPLRRRGTGLIGMLVVSIGLSMVAMNVFLYFLGGRTRPYAQYAIQRGLDLGPISLAARDLVAIAISLIVLAGLGLVLQRTRIGTATRAVADNKDLAASSGINVERVILFVWMAGGALAALGGTLAALTSQVSFDLGSNLLLLMFAGVTLGGLGTAYGALLGSVIVGIFIQMSTLVIAPELKNAGALLVLILILLVKPEGLLGRRERVG